MKKPSTNSKLTVTTVKDFRTDECADSIPEIKNIESILLEQKQRKL